jgi:hypothetical protein
MLSLLSNPSSIVNFVTMEICSMKHVDGSGHLRVKYINECEPATYVMLKIYYTRVQME